MIFKPANWSIVILGQWNPALFTPGCISRRLFALPDATPVEVLVSIDVFAPPRVKHDGITVYADNQKLTIDLVNNDLKSLESALQFARKAINDLPHTPVSAAGFNLRYRADAFPDSLIALLANSLDDRISDAGYEISSRAYGRALKLDTGTLNLNVSSSPECAAEVALNFERRSTSAKDLVDWLNMPIDRIKGITKSTWVDILSLSAEDIASEEREDVGAIA